MSEAQAELVTQRTEIRKPKDIRGWLQDDGLKSQIAKALPKHCTADRMCRAGLTALTKTPALARCSVESFMEAFMTLSQWGLEPDGRHAHLIPYGNKVQLVIDYKGLIKLAYQGGFVKSIRSDVVCENDEYEENMGDVIRHVVNRRGDRGSVFAVYCVIELADGARHTEIMSRHEIEDVRKRSKAGESGPWKTDWNEMAKKGLALDTPIPTPDGWTTMGDLAVGDVVFDMHGQQTTVMAVSEVKHLDCFRVQFADGESIVCDDEHRWVARIEGAGRPEWPVHTINDLYAAKANGLAVSMPVAGSLSLGVKDLPIDPWLLGYWLGDGHSHCASVTCHVDDIEHFSSGIAGTRYSIGKIRPDVRSHANQVGVKNGFKAALRNSKLLANKHIPAEYLRASHEQRLRLLQGLMDSDGHVEKHRGRAILEQTNELLAKQACELLASLGEKFICNEYFRSGFRTTCKTYRIEWQPVNCPVSLPRKAARFRERTLTPYRGVADIRRTITVPTKCIAVDSPTHTYLAGRTMVPTHNTVFRRASKWIPLGAEVINAFDRDDDRPEFVQAPKAAVTAEHLEALIGGNEDA